MQYTYEEAVRELSGFLGKHATADNYWKMEQVLLTILNADENTLHLEFDRGYETGFEDAKTLYENASYDRGYEIGYNNGVKEERDAWMCK